MTAQNLKLRGAAGEINVARPVVVGVVNATPDSFSDRGDRSIAGSVNQVHEHLEAGAGVIEVGGESNVTNRPPVTAAIEIDRILPVVEAAVAAGAIVSVPYAASSSAGSRARAMGGASVGSVRAVTGYCALKARAWPRGDRLHLRRSTPRPRNPRCPRNRSR